MVRDSGKRKGDVMWLSLASLATVSDRARGLLHIRHRRTTPEPGPKPRAGAYVVYGHVRMIVREGMDDDLWDWLQQHGWRESAFWPERRRYREAPVACMEDLIDVPAELRPLVLRDALALAMFPTPLLDSRT